MKFIFKWFLLVVAILFSGYLVPGVSVASIWTAFWLSVFLGIINVTLKPLLVVLTLPINILTLGLFTFVINALIILLAASVIQGFAIAGFWSALLLSLVLALVNALLNRVFKSI